VTQIGPVPVSHEDGLLADIGSAVGDALQVVDDPEKMGRAGQCAGILQHRNEQFLVERALVGVYGGILVPDLPRQAAVRAGIGVETAAQHRDRQPRHQVEVR
jgi:hypothetical protein